MSCVAIDSQDLLSCGQGVTPGIALTLYYALKRQLTEVPARAEKTDNISLAAAATAVAGGKFTFIQGGKFSKIEGLLEPAFESPMDGMKRSKMGKPKLTFKLPLTVEAEGFLELYKNEEVILVFKDADGVLRQLGDLDFPAYMVNGDPVNTETEKTITFAFEAGPRPVLVLPATIAIPLVAAA